tara:strand:+ start:19 stop:504 length:486 start_codon:yes stop_codon:yes gene_type:complete
MYSEYYNILGISNDANEEDIKKAYKKLAVKYHPDKQGNASDEEKKTAEENFKKVAEAYEILTNKSQAPNNMNSFSHKFVDPHVIFNQLFREMNVGNRTHINIPMPQQSNCVIRSSSTVIHNGKRVETIQENINGVTRQRVIVTELGNQQMPGIVRNINIQL